MKLLILCLLVGCSRQATPDFLIGPAPISQPAPPAQPVPLTLMEGKALFVVATRMAMGGETAWTPSLTVHADGTVTSNGVNGTLPPGTVAELRAWLSSGMRAGPVQMDPGVERCLAVPDTDWQVSSPALDAGLGEWSSPCAGSAPVDVSEWMARLHREVMPAPAAP